MPCTRPRVWKSVFTHLHHTSLTLSKTLSYNDLRVTHGSVSSLGLLVSAKANCHILAAFIL